jgi:GNAT superfamily N-acetyltransferase
MSRVIRKYTSQDREACLEIYRANLEAGLIPDRYENEFLTELDSGDTLTLVIAVDGQVLGCGSVRYFWDAGRSCANLSFGLIHPDHHRKQLGSYLLVSRLSLLNRNKGECATILSATDHSIGFYAEVVGFSKYDQTRDEFGNRFHELILNVGPRRLQDAQDYMAASGFKMEPNLEIPVSLPGSIRFISWDQNSSS